ncbi:RagB/SusD family nutrient uptake outer membrane protein [Niabella sp. CJ426]|uniref:RagB/SusD family nutrient uptake outer membrane protein n=1 Tax=Niabella sp. CJ426 TaxID=3393740 RepID=UPI003D006648
MQNTYKLYLFIFFLATAIPFSSCKKYLDKKPSNGIATPESIDDLQALLDDATLVMNQNATPSFGETSADDYFVLPAYYKTTAVNNQHFYIWQPYEYNYPNDWSRSYTVIYNANYCLDMLGKQEVSDKNKARWNNVYGSAKFYRAYYYLQLAFVYTKAYDAATSKTDEGIVLRESSDFNIPSKRANVEDTYKQIVEDTREAINYLPDLPVHVFRPSKAAAYGLLARTFLSMRIYDSAYRYANLCLQLKNDLMDFNADADVLAFTTTYPIKKFNKETIFYTEMYTGFNSYPMVLTTRSKIDSLLYQSFDANDLRKKAWFLLSDGYYRFRGTYSQTSIPFTGLATDEMYLIRAECMARKGDDALSGAINDLNILLQKRFVKAAFVPYASTSKTDVLNKILDERRKELLFRAIRWSDIKRLNKEGRNIMLQREVGGKIYSLQANSNYYALPLPYDIVTLTGIKQNTY